MPSLRIDILKELANEMNNLRAEVESITSAAVSADSALGKMARQAQTFGSAAKQLINETQQEIRIIDSHGQPVQPSTPGTAPSGIGLSPQVQAPSPTYNPFGFSSQRESISSMLQGTNRVGLQDIAQIQLSNAQYESASGQKRLQEMSTSLQKGGALEQLVGTELKTLSKSFKEQADIVAKLTNELKSASGSEEELQKKRQQLIDATSKAAQTRERLTQAEETAAKLSPGGSGGGGAGGGSWWGGMSFGGKMGLIGSAVGLAAAGVGMGMGYYGAQTVGYESDVLSNLRAAQSTGASESMRWQRQMGIHDMTRGENVMRYFANYMSPDTNYNYIGTRGRQNAMSEAQRITQNELFTSEREQNLSLMRRLTGAVGGAAGSALTGVGAGAATGGLIGALGGPIGAAGGAAIGGIIGVMKSLFGMAETAPSAAAEYQSNLAARRSGGLAGTGIGRFMYGDQANQMAENTRRQYAADQQLTEEQRAQAMTNAELQQTAVQRKIMGYDAYRDIIETRKRAVSQLGGGATSSLSSILGIPLGRALTQSVNMPMYGQNETIQLGDQAKEYSLPQATGGLLNFSVPPKATPQQIAQQQQESDRVNGMINMISNRDMSIAQFDQQKYMLSSALSKNASMAQTGRFIDLSRAGLGTSEQLTSNLMGLQQVSGRQENLSQLEKVLANAVSAGFDKAQFAQRFVQATTELSASLRVSDTTSMANQLAFVSQSMTQKGDLLGLNMAQQGMAQVANFTGQQGGTTGALRAYSYFQSGGSMASGAGLTTGMNTYQLGQARNIVSQMAQGKSLQSISSDPRITASIRVESDAESKKMFNKGFGELTKSEKEQVLQVVKTRYGNVSDASLSVLRGVTNMFAESAGTSYAQIQDQARNALQRGDTEGYKLALAQIMNYGQVKGMDEMGVATAFISDVTSNMDMSKMGISEAHQKKLLNEVVGKGTAAYKDPMSIERQRFLNKMTVTSAREFNRNVTEGMLKDYFAPGMEGEGLAVSLPGEGGTNRATTIKSMGDFQKLSKEDKASVLNQLTVSNLVTGQMSAMARAEGTERFIGGFEDHALSQLTGAISKALQGRDEPAAYNVSGSRGVRTMSPTKFPEPQ
jgi:hypothetical protein